MVDHSLAYLLAVLSRLGLRWLRWLPFDILRLVRRRDCLCTAWDCDVNGRGCGKGVAVLLSPPRLITWLASCPRPPVLSLLLLLLLLLCWEAAAQSVYSSCGGCSCLAGMASWHCVMGVLYVSEMQALIAPSSPPPPLPTYSGTGRMPSASIAWVRSRVVMQPASSARTRTWSPSVPRLRPT